MIFPSNVLPFRSCLLYTSKRIEAGLIRKAMAEPWEKLGFALTLNLLTLTISFFSGTLWLLFFASLIIDGLAGLEAWVQKAVSYTHLDVYKRQGLVSFYTFEMGLYMILPLDQQRRLLES